MAEFLGVEDAIRNKLLSRRWRCLYPENPTLCFRAEGVFQRDENALCSPAGLKDHPEMFVAWVDKVLQQFRAPKIGALKVFGRVESKYASNVDEWIRLACLMRAETIHLFFKNYTKPKPYTFPFHLLDATEFSNLKDLTLFNASLPNFSTSSGPIISVTSFRMLNQNVGSFEDIASYFPNLKHFTFCFREKVPTMRRLCDLWSRLYHLKSLELWSFGCPMDVEICDLNLTTFSSCGPMRNISFKGLNCLEFVKIKTPWFHFKGAADFLSSLPEGAPKLNNLSLSSITWTDFRFPTFMCTFKCLKCLDLMIDTLPDSDFQSLSRFLQVAPVLQELSIVALYSEE